MASRVEWRTTAPLLGPARPGHHQLPPPLGTRLTHPALAPADMADTEELVDYEEEEVLEPETAKGETVKKGYVGIHSSGFKDFLLKPELLRAIQDCGFEHPSEGALQGRHG